MTGIENQLPFPKSISLRAVRFSTIIVYPRSILFINKSISCERYYPEISSIKKKYQLMSIFRFQYCRWYGLSYEIHLHQPESLFLQRGNTSLCLFERNTVDNEVLAEMVHCAAAVQLLRRLEHASVRIDGMLLCIYMYDIYTYVMPTVNLIGC